jgi:hypothetical protein
MQKSGKDHSLLLVLPSGIYRYIFVVDGERRCLPDLPCETDSMGNVVNLLDVNVSCLSFALQTYNQRKNIGPNYQQCFLSSFAKKYIYNVFLVQSLSYKSVVQESG